MSSFRPLTYVFSCSCPYLGGSEIALESRRSFIPIGMGQTIIEHVVYAPHEHVLPPQFPSESLVSHAWMGCCTQVR